jgi:hypothetical protein
MATRTHNNSDKIETNGTREELEYGLENGRGIDKTRTHEPGYENKVCLQPREMNAGSRIVDDYSSLRLVFS